MRLRFGDCLFDLEARELRRDGQAVPLSPKGFQLLALLLEERPEALPQQRLRDALWPDSHVGYTSLAQVVAELRRSIGDSAKRARFVRTVPRFGYVFVGEVAEARRFEPLPIVGAFVGEDREYLVAAGETLVGRGVECHVRLPSRRVSRVHARVRADRHGVVVVDTGSKNGTWVNGQRQDAPTALEDGDEVLFGTFRVVFRALGGSTSTRTGHPSPRSGSGDP
jgi:DNA-binding winged helix-turn-helix (wHTH) protein